MNRIYRVIWSRVKNCYVVVSEMANSRTKSNGSRIVKKTALAVMVLAGLSLSGMGLSSYAADNIVVDSGAATGTTNTVTDDKTARVVGRENSVTGSEGTNVMGDTNTVEDSNNVNIVGNDNKVTKSYPYDGGTRYEASLDTRIFGNNNEVRGSRKQNVIGDNNKIIARDVGTVTDYGHPEGREPNISDLTIGRGNVITGNDTYRNEWDALTVIGNNNNIRGTAAGIVIGDNRNNTELTDSIIIGSLSPDEKNSDDNNIRARNMVVIGYHAFGSDGSMAIGSRVKTLGPASAAVGIRSTVEGTTYYATLYGIDNKISTESDTGLGASIAPGAFGMLNKVDSSFNSMVFGTGNRVTNAFGNINEGIEGGFLSGRMGELLYHGGDDIGYKEHFSEIMGDYATLNGGSVFAMGNGNVSDYARRSSIFGTGNTLNGTEASASDYNLVTGYQNKATNVNHVSVMGTSNKLSDAATDVVIGDYHTLSGGKNNVILGTMGTTDGYEEQTYTPQSYAHTTGELQWTGDTLHYVVKVQKPLREHTENISNAVMVGYNTDVQKDDGVAIGSNAVSSVDKGAFGYNPITGNAFENEAAIVAYTGKEDRFAELNSSIPDLESALSTAKADYETKVSDYLAKNADYVQAVHAYNNIDHDSDRGKKIKEQMDAAKIANDDARAAMDTSETAMNDANKAYTAAVSEKTQITSAWQSGAAAVSVGDSETGLTRQITNVAAGTNDTDAVNVAQLKAAVDAAGTGLQESNEALTFKDNKLGLSIKNSEGTEIISGSVNLSTIAAAVDTRNTIANADGDNTISIDSTGKNTIGGTNYKIKVNTDGKVASGNTGIVTGGTVYNETRVAEDGTYVKKSKSAGDNLTALDSQVASNTTQITTNTANITNLSNQVTDISGSVTNLNSRVSKLDTRINRVGAGAAALAALHPQDYDPTAKWDFAAGYGNYNSANAVAIGAFYRPTNDVLFSIGTSLGGGENMFNAGVSFKFGQGSPYAGYSKDALVGVISEQQQEIDTMKAENEAKDRRIEALEKQMQDIMNRLNG
ncbi:ESPR-type extended signal peptide-containing protein [uncultured Megasphaera sp.]|uniref:ESPR-type extended signal peptide-containing protein n=1 Tax=uncultured Megasphaera sp. TaxID=165188 RepID=UPI0025F21FE2|nr:ESPR-type extended signal peptide-containing protein [uncultured Megasphaera sp.]